MIYPKVSIMIPTYNRAHYLVKAIESSLTQDYPNIEVIVSDNASTDNTPEIARKYQDNPKVKYFRNQSNIGLAANWRKLLYQYASGEYGKLLCDDDYLIDQSHISESMNLIHDYHLNLVMSGSLIKYENRTADNLLPRKIIFKMPNMVPPDWWIDNLGRRQEGTTLFPNLVGSAVFNLRMARELQAFQPGIYGLDYELLLKLILSGNSGYLPGPHWTERHHESDAVSADFATAFEGARLFRRVYHYGISLGFPDRQMATFERRAAAPFVRTFLVPKWLAERGGSLSSLLSLRKEIRKINPIIFTDVIFHAQSLSIIIKYNNTALYYPIRKLYRYVKNVRLNIS